MSSRKKQKKQTSITEPSVSAGAGPLFFYEDEIFRVTKGGETEFGMVTENWEMYSSDSEMSDEDHETDKVPKGHVAVTWHPSGKEGVVPESKVQLSDRSLMPGDVVRRLISGKDTQRGYARNVKVKAVVQTIGSKEVFPNVLASSLNPVQKFPPDVAVYMDSWIGSVRDMRYKLTLRFNDKSTCVVDSYTIAEYFDDVRPAAGGFQTGDMFYPGQRLQGSIRYLRNAEWIFISEDLKRAKDRKQVTGIVTRVESVGVSVQWQYPTPVSPLEQELAQKVKSEVDNTKDVKAEEKNAETKTEGEEEKKMESEKDWNRKKPADFITGDDIKRLKTLNLFDSCTVQLGDISFYVPSPNEASIDKRTWKKVKDGYLWPSNEKIPTSKVEEEEYSSTDNEVEDASSCHAKGNTYHGKNKNESSASFGTSKKNLPKVSTRSLRKKKLKKTRQAATVTDPASKETQLVVETIHTSSIVDVVWQDGTIEEGVRSIDLYPIHHLDDNEFFPGDFVVRADSNDPNIYGVVQSMDHSGRVANVKWFEVYWKSEETNRPKELKVEEMSVYDIKDHPDFRFRPGTVVFCIANFQPNQVSGGQVLDNCPDGQIRVWWANNVEQTCWPQDLYRIGDYDSDDGELWDANVEEEAGSDDSWCTTDEEDVDKNESSTKKFEERKKSIEKITGSKEVIVKELTVDGVVEIHINPEGNTGEPGDTPTPIPSTPDIVSIVEKEPIPQFSMLDSVPSSHRFYSTLFQPANARNFLKTVQKELCLLRHNLPPGVIVKGYEDRMDLYSIMIHGPKNTPYEDGIFFFDMQLPASYPDSPPIVHYVSFCQSRLNPNLYECGKVCVSLLGTWSGKGNEIWTSSSSVLQLLISIQGLILVPEPYYNEAGYERQRGSQQAEENSRMYNEMVLIKLVQSMTRMYSYPHASWVAESMQHIESRGPIMIDRYKKWLDNSTSMHAKGGDASAEKCMMGATSKEDPGFPLLPVSKGFAISLRKMLDTFEKVYSRNPPAIITSKIAITSAVSPTPPTDSIQIPDAVSTSALKC